MAATAVARTPSSARRSTAFGRTTTGFRKPGTLLLSGLRIPPTTVKVTATPAVHATKRNFRDGRWPSGNNSSTNVGTEIQPGAHTHWFSQAPMTAPNGAPGRAREASVLSALATADPAV